MELAKTYLDELVEYPAKVLRAIGTDKDVVSLLLDDWEVDMDSDEADSVFDKYLYDYLYVDNTSAESKAYICVEAELNKNNTTTMQDFRLYVTVICHKEYMKLDPRKCKGTMGNRRDNLVRAIDLVLDKFPFVGLGRLSLVTIRTVPSPAGFTTRELTYKVSDFRDNGVSKNTTP